MADQGDKKDEKKKSQPERVKEAIVNIAETQDGQIFFNWLQNTCMFTRSTIEANPQAQEINPLGTIFNESRRRLYLDVRRAIPKALRNKFED